MMRLTLILGAFVASCLAQEERAIVRFANGDQLSGEVGALSKETLVWNSMILKEPAEFDLKHVVDLSMPATLAENDDKVRPEHIATLEMTNGDSIQGQLAGLTDEEIRLNTWYAGAMVFRRVNVKSVLIERNSDYLYRGPNSIEEWTADRLQTEWSFKDGALYAGSAGGIAREVDFPEEFIISFDAAWRGTFRPKVVFRSDDITTSNPESGYEMIFQGNSVYVKRGDSNNPLGRSNNSGILRENEKARIEIRFSSASGKILLYIDGEFVDLWEDDDVEKPRLGKGFHIVSQDSSPLRISNLSVTGWDGYIGELPNRQDRFRNRNFGAELDFGDEEAPGGEEAAVADENRMILRNGDTIDGEVTSVSNERITIKTKFSEVEIPVERLKNVVLKSADMETPKRNKGDVRATLADGTKLVFRLDSVEKGVLEGFSQNFGTARFNRDAFRKIEFNIYDRLMEERRKLDDWAP